MLENNFFEYSKTFFIFLQKKNYLENLSFEIFNIFKNNIISVKVTKVLWYFGKARFFVNWQSS